MSGPARRRLDGEAEETTMGRLEMLSKSGAVAGGLVLLAFATGPAGNRSAGSTRK